MEADIRVLVVDDDVDFRALLRWQLGRQDGIEVVGDAADGFEALERVEELTPQAAVVDLMMPGMDGFELIQHLQSRHPDVRIVAYSAMASDHARQQLAELGVEMLTKSGNHTLLVEAVHRLMASDDGAASSS